PPSAPVGGYVVLSGSGFTEAAVAGSSVQFNGVTATSITNWSNTSITVGVPSGATSGPITVTTHGVTNTGARFTVRQPVSISGISPTSGPAGTIVTISGSGFGSQQSSSTVIFNGLPAASITSWSDTQIQAVVPQFGTSGPVSAIVAGLWSTGSDFTLTS